MGRREDSAQIRRMAHRLHALYICEMTGKGCIDPVYRKLRQKPPNDVFLRIAEQLLPVFHRIFVAHMDTSQSHQLVKQLIAFQELDLKKQKPQ